MENLHEILGSKWFKISCAVASVVFGYAIVKRFTPREKKNAPKDTVILYQVGRGPKAPSISPFPLKLETYLRMANIPYENDHTGKFSSKGKTPWMEYNGVAVADSQFCIEYLNKELGIDLNAHLTAEQKAIARAFQKMTEENLYWVLLSWNCIHDSKKEVCKLFPYPRPIALFFYYKLKGKAVGYAKAQGMGRHTSKEVMTIFQQDIQALGIRTLAIQRWLYGTKKDLQYLFQNIRLSVPLFLMRKTINSEVHGQGIGRHSKEEVLKIGKDDLKALSDYLSQKPFLMGDEPCETDCAIFGMLAQHVWHMPNSPYEIWIKEEFPNLIEYCYRMKERFWPDWDENITEPERKKME